MKKIITGIVTLTMALGMTACSDSGENNNSTTTSTTTSTATETTTVATTPSEETTTTTTTSADITTTTEQTTTTTVTTTKETTTTTAKETKEQVLIDSNGIKITFKGMDYSDGIFGPEVKLLIENNTDKNYTVQARNFSVNGFMIETSMSTDVNAGKKANDTIIIENWSLEDNSISATDMQTLEFNFSIFNSDDWTDSFDSETVNIQL